MIQILLPSGDILEPSEITFEGIQALCGHVQMVPITEGSVPLHVCCDEDGMRKGLPFNHRATMRFRNTINLGPDGALGVWVVLSGKDLLK